VIWNFNFEMTLHLATHVTFCIIRELSELHFHYDCSYSSGPPGFPWSWELSYISIMFAPTLQGPLGLRGLRRWCRWSWREGRGQQIAPRPAPCPPWWSTWTQPLARRSWWTPSRRRWRRRWSPSPTSVGTTCKSLPECTEVSRKTNTSKELLGWSQPQWQTQKILGWGRERGGKRAARTRQCSNTRRCQSRARRSFLEVPSFSIWRAGFETTPEIMRMSDSFGKFGVKISLTSITVFVMKEKYTKTSNQLYNRSFN